MTDETELGRVTWHSSDEDSGPDVGLSLGLGGGRALYIGELAEQTLEDNEIGEHVQGIGWWIALETAKSLDVAGAVAKPDEARELFDAIAGAFAAITSERDSLLAALKPFGDIYEHHMTKGKYGPAWGFNDGTLLHEDFARAAALTTKES